MFDGCTHGALGIGTPRFLAEFRMCCLELSHLPVGTPSQIAVPGVPKIGVGDGLEAACSVKAPRYLVGQTFVLHEAVLVGGANGLLVEAHGIGISLLDAGDLG